MDLTFNERDIMLKLLILAISLFQSISFANDPSSYKLEIIRDSKTQQKMVYRFWSGEYPQPVIDVQSKIKGKTVITASTSLRNPSETVSCTINNGVYHPWSQAKNNTPVIFYSVKSQEDYLVKKKTSMERFVYESETSAGRTETYEFNPGDQIQNIYYAGEGYCVGSHIQTIKKQKKLTEIDFSCELVDDKNSFKRLTPPTAKDDLIEQWLYISCAEGHKAFIRDNDLLASPGVKEGTIKDYGSVGPAN